MKIHFIGFNILLFLSLWFFSGCDLLPPELQLAASVDDWNYDGGNHVVIDYTLENIGDTTLENCKVEFGIDENLSPGIVYDEITYWDPTPGIDLSPGETYSGTVTSIDQYPLDAEYVGVYAVGFDNPPDD